ncbi:BMC domain-containing protein [Brevibacillus massiliensis]|uniref:BMC domain-containing protein n=1 Tax=Brevibacillus massiliensis TaxID=1118054 RepID=UPI0002FADA99|nr:BMC domain-containing protein [Brevibacillus massiliensis]
MNHGDALGMIETWGFPALVAAADAAAKAADVRIVTYQGADAGIVTIYIIGDVASVQSAVAVGEAEARRVGQLRSSHVIARPDGSVPQMIRGIVEKKEKKQAAKQAKAEKAPGGKKEPAEHQPEEEQKRGDDQS